MRKIALTLPLLATLAQCFYLPGIIPKSYTYKDKLPISISAKLTSDRPHVQNFNSKGRREEVHLSRDTLQEYDFCDPEDGFMLEKTKHSSAAGFFADQIINSAYTVDLMNARMPTDVAGMPLEKDGRLPPQAGVSVCKRVCSKYWNLQKVMRFS